MRLVRDGEGFTIDARDLGELLDIGPEEVRAEMQAGAITTLCERGEAEDAGRFRLTFTHGSRRVRLIVDTSGQVLQRSRTRYHPHPSLSRRG
jgi:hypothetical protein